MSLFDDIAKVAQSVIGGAPTKESTKEDVIVTLLDGSKAKKKDVPIGEAYINEEGQKVRKLIKQPVAIESTEQMKSWLNQLSPHTSPAISVAIDSQLQVLDNVFSASLAGMAIDNMLFALQKALQCASTEMERVSLCDNFCMMIQSFVFINEAKLLYASEENRMEAANLLGQAGSRMMTCAINIGMSAINFAQMSAVADVADSGAKAAANTLSKKITTSTVPPIAKNPFEGAEGDKLLGDLVKSLAKKKILDEKRAEFDKMMGNLFPMFARYSEMIGPSVLITGLLERYADKLVKDFETKRYNGLFSRTKDFQPPKKFLTSAPPTDYDYVRALEIEINAEAMAAANALKQEREELEEYKSELKKTGLFKKERREHLSERIRAQEDVIKQQRDIAEVAENTRYKLEQLLAPVKADVEAYSKKLKSVVDKYDCIGN